MTFPLMPAHTRAIFLVLLSSISLAVGQTLSLVYGISNSSFNLTSSSDPNNVKDFTWKHDVNGTRYKIAKYKNGGTLVEIYDSRYNLFNNGTVLGINKLNHNDSGQYFADVTYHDDTSKEEKIDLIVFDPIPPLQIQIKEQKRIGDRCHVTLFCYVLSNTTDFSYTWKCKQGDSEYQQYNNGSTIQISLGNQDMEFICIVYSPADQKNASVHVKHCLEENTRYHHIVMVFLISMFVVVMVALSVVAVISWICRKRSLFTTGKGDLDGEIRPQIVEEHENEDERNDHEGHETEEYECEGHEIELLENGGHENEEHLPILVEESRDQTEVEEHENNEPENEEHLTIPVEESGEQDGNNVNETENEENLTIPVQETGNYTKMQPYNKNVEKIEQLHEDENTGLLQDRK